MKRNVINLLTMILLMQSSFVYGQGGTLTTRPVNETGVTSIKKITKVISKEYRTISTPKIGIDNKSQNFELKTWDQDKVKIEVYLTHDSSVNYSEKELWDKTNIVIAANLDSVNILLVPFQSIDNYSIKLDGSGKTLGTTQVVKNNTDAYDNNVAINSKPGKSGNTLISSESNSLSNRQIDDNNESDGFTINATGKIYSTGDLNKLSQAAKKRNSRIIIYIPRQSVIKLSNQSGNIIFKDPIITLNIHTVNGNVYGGGVENLNLYSKYSTIDMGIVSKAVIEIEKGSFTAASINILEINSQLAYVELGVVKDAFITQSSNDEYEMNEVNLIRGKKNFGKLRIDNLTGGCNLAGESMDVSIRTISKTAESIIIDNRYAKLKLPVTTLNNYSVHFSGPNSNILAPSSMNMIPEEKKSDDGSEIIAWNASAGDLKNKFTSLQVQCPNCSVSLK